MSFHSIDVVKNVPEHVEMQRELRLFLAGPRRQWPVTSVITMSRLGKMDCEVQNERIDLGENCPFQVDIRPHYYFSKSDYLEREPTQFTDVYALSFKNTDASVEMPGEAFRSEALKIADDLTRLVSFLSQNRTTWYAYDFLESHKIVHHVRQTLDCASTMNPFARGLILHTKQPILRLGYEGITDLRAKGIDMTVPFTYYLAGTEAKFLEQRFTAFFLAMESCKDMFCELHELNELMPSSQFGSFRRSFREWLQREIPDPQLCGHIGEKTGELNRASLRTLLDRLFAEYNVMWDDIYPENAELLLIKTRNRLFHTGKPMPVGRLARETERAQVIVERLILGMLGLSEFAEPVDWILARHLRADI